MKRVLLDEGAPRPLAAKLRALGVDANPFPNDWKQLSNGKLLDAVEKHGFDVLLTNDKSMPYQQMISGRRLAVVVLPSNNLRAVQAIAAGIAAALAKTKPGVTYRLDHSGALVGEG